MIAEQTISELLYTYVKEESKEALVLFLKKQADIICRVIKKTLRNLSDTEDVLQSVFIIILTKSKDIKYLDQLNDGLITGWCITIARNAAKMKNREEKRRKNREEIISSKAVVTCNQQQDPLNSQKALTESIYVAIDKLPDNYRLPIHLHYVENIELKQIAKILNLNPNTLRTHLKRGLSKLSQILKSSGVVTAGTLLVSTLNSLPLEAASTEMVDKVIGETLDYTPPSNALPSNLPFAKIPLFLEITFISIISFTTFLFINNFEDKSKSATNHTSTTTLKSYEWDFSNGIPSELSLYMGVWEKEENKDYITFSKSRSHLILMPIKKRHYPIIIEAELSPKYFPNEEILKSKETTGLVFNAIVHDNQNNYVAKTFFRKDYSFHYQSNITSKMYLSSDWTYGETNNKFTDLTRYENIFEGYVLIVLQNYNLKKLKIYEVEKLPEHVTKQAAEKINSNKGIDHITLKNNKKIKF